MEAVVKEYLTSRGLEPRPAWLTSFVGSQRAEAPIPVLKQTAWFRILNSDLTQSIALKPESVLPSGIRDGAVQEKRLAGPCVVQVLDYEDIGHSRWSQLEAMEAHERGETTKGREIIRVVPGEEASTNASGPESTGPLKLLLQDAAGVTLYAFDSIASRAKQLTSSVGIKIMIRDAVIARGVLLLDESTVVILGGKIESLHAEHQASRKQELKRHLGIPNP